MKRLFRALPFVLCLCLIVCAVATPANAEEYLKPSDYLVDVTADGYTKTAHYSFSKLSWLISAWNSTTGEYVEFENDCFYFPDVSYKEVLISAYPFGGGVYGDTIPWNGVVLDISDILPGSPIDFEFPFYIRSSWETYENVTASVSCTYGMAYYDKNGNFLNTIYGAPYSFEFTMGSTIYKEWEEKFTISGSIPARASYICPFVKVDTVLSAYVPDMQIAFGGGAFDLYIDVNTVIENSNMMQSINNKLDDISDKLDDISGALNGDANVDAGVSDFSDANDTLNNAMQSAGTAMNAGSDSVSDIANSSVMAGTLSSLGSGLSVAFSDEFQVNLCGMSFNPFALWVTVIGGFSLIALMVAYIFRKRGGS